MGLAVDQGFLVLGTQCTIDEFRNMPALCPRLDPPDRYDAAYVWRNTHVTGAIDIHELDLGTDGRVYFVNTAFSCLCVTDHEYSFVSMSLGPHPRLCLRGPLPPQRPGSGRRHAALRYRPGRHRYIPQGWRANKRDGGILIDLEADAIIAHGLGRGPGGVGQGAVFRAAGQLEPQRCKGKSL